jgi:hypothetical protein
MNGLMASVKIARLKDLQRANKLHIMNVHTFTMREQRKRLNKIMLNGQNIDQDTHKLQEIATNNTRHIYQNGEQRKI